MMAYKASDGKEYSMSSRMRAHEHDLKLKPAGGEKKDVLKPPQAETGEHEGGDVGEHLKALHEAHGGRHMHVHQSDEAHVTTHHVDEDGQVQGPHEHASMDDLHNHLESVFGGEPGGEQEEEPEAEPAEMG